MNLVDLATELEYVPKEQLAQMSQDPSSRYPQYLVLSEIQRRTANEKAYAAAKPRPTTTVAEEVVGEFMRPQSLQAGMPSESAPTDAFSSESMGIPASAPMQQPMMMAGGGQTKAEAREGIIDMMSDINIKRGEAGLSGLMDAAGDVITAGSAVIPINAAGKLALIEKAMKPLSGAYRKALEASRKGNVEYANLDPLVKEQAKKYIQLGKESDKASFALGAGVPTTFSLGVANQLGKFKYQDEDKKASGGLTEYMEEVGSELKRIKEKESRYAARNKREKEGKTIFSTSLSPRKYVIPDETYKKLTDQGMVRAFNAYRPMGLLFNALSGEGAFSGMDRTIPESKLKNLESAMKQSRNEMQQRQLGLASGGLTGYATGDRTALNETFYNPISNVGSSSNPYPVDDEVSFLEDRYIDEEGNIRYGTALGDATFVIPGLGALGAVGRLGLGALRRYAPNILQKTKGLFTSPNPALASLKTGQRKVKTDKGYDTIDTATGKKIPEQLFDAKKSLAAVSYPAAAATLISRSADDEETTKPTNTETDTEKQLRLQREEYEKQLAELRNKATGTAKPKKEIDYDLVGLGGLIMGARNMSELGTGLAGLAERKQAREDALLEGQAQQDYYRASADKVRAEIEGLPLENKMDALEKVNDILTKALEGEIELTEEQLQYYNVASQTLTSQILALQGITANSLTGLDPLEENRIQ